MKKPVVFIATIILMGACLLKAEAAWFGKKKETPKKTAIPSASTDKVTAKEPGQKEQPQQKKEAEQKKIDKDQQKAQEVKRARVAEKRKRLNNSEWQIQLRPLSGVAASKEKMEADLIVFKDNQVALASFEKKGFLPTNYTLSVQDDGTVVWETMQNSEKQGTAFWRGEMDVEMTKMQGILSYHLDEKTIRDYSFVSLSKGALTPVAGGN